MKNKILKIRYMAFLAGILGLLCMKDDIIAAQVQAGGCTGLLPLTEEEREFLSNSSDDGWINLNKDALKIIKEGDKNIDDKLLGKIKVTDVGEECVAGQSAVSKAREADARAAQKELVSQKESYDVSENDTFPTIGDQGQTGSCAAWSIGYYQLTNNIAKVRGLNVKNTGTAYRIAPGWLYNICKTELYNNILIDGTSYLDIVSVLMKQGAPYWSAAYGQTTEKNYKSWNPDALVWEKALENRIEKYKTIDFWDSNGKLDLTELKTTLLNGYVVSFSSTFSRYSDSNTAYDDWIIDKSSGKTVIKAMKVIQGTNREPTGHEMTIVGFDDNIRVDYGIHPVTKKHQYGYGALKIANSWGTGWGDSGYCWIAYDAIRKESEFTGDHSIYRVPAIAEDSILLIEPRKAYTPLLLAKLTVETNSRRQLGIAFDIAPGVKEENMRYVYRYENNSNNIISVKCGTAFWFKNRDVTTQNLSFSGQLLGTGKRESAVFLFDLTDTVLQKYNKYNNSSGNNDIPFYVYIQDELKDNYTSALTKIEIIDRINNKSVSKATNLVVDGDTKSERLDFTIVPRIVGAQKAFNLNFNYPIQSSSMTNGVAVRKKVKGASGYSSSAFGITCSPSADRKKITVNPVAGNYENGSYYSLEIGDVRSDGGNPLTGQSVFDFYIPGY